MKKRTKLFLILFSGILSLGTLFSMSTNRLIHEEINETMALYSGQPEYINVTTDLSSKTYYPGDKLSLSDLDVKITFAGNKPVYEGNALDVNNVSSWTYINDNLFDLACSFKGNVGFDQANKKFVRENLIKEINVETDVHNIELTLWFSIKELTDSIKTNFTINESLETITLNKDGGLEGANSVNLTRCNEKGLTYFSKSTTAISVPWKKGYIFDGYYTSNGTQFYDAKGNTIYTSASNACNFGDDNTLTAVWKKSRSLVRLDVSLSEEGKNKKFYEDDYIKPEDLVVKKVFSVYTNGIYTTTEETTRDFRIITGARLSGFFNSIQIELTKGTEGYGDSWDSEWIHILAFPRERTIEKMTPSFRYNDINVFEGDYLSDYLYEIELAFTFSDSNEEYITGYDSALNVNGNILTPENCTFSPNKLSYGTNNVLVTFTLDGVSYTGNFEVIAKKGDILYEISPSPASEYPFLIVLENEKVFHMGDTVLSEDVRIEYWHKYASYNDSRYVPSENITVLNPYLESVGPTSIYVEFTIGDNTYSDYFIIAVMPSPSVSSAFVDLGCRIIDSNENSTPINFYDEDGTYWYESDDEDRAFQHYMMFENGYGSDPIDQTNVEVNYFYENVYPMAGVAEKVNFDYDKNEYVTTGHNTKGIALLPGTSITLPFKKSYIKEYNSCTLGWGFNIGEDETSTLEMPFAVYLNGETDMPFYPSYNEDCVNQMICYDETISKVYDDNLKDIGDISSITFANLGTSPDTLMFVDYFNFTPFDEELDVKQVSAYNFTKLIEQDSLYDYSDFKFYVDFNAGAMALTGGELIEGLIGMRIPAAGMLMNNYNDILLYPCGINNVILVLYANGYFYYSKIIIPKTAQVLRERSLKKVNSISEAVGYGDNCTFGYTDSYGQTYALTYYNDNDFVTMGRIGGYEENIYLYEGDANTFASISIEYIAANESEINTSHFSDDDFVATSSGIILRTSDWMDDQSEIEHKTSRIITPSYYTYRDDTDVVGTVVDTDDILGLIDNNYLFDIEYFEDDYVFVSKRTDGSDKKYLMADYTSDKLILTDSPVETEYVRRIYIYADIEADYDINKAGDFYCAQFLKSLDYSISYNGVGACVDEGYFNKLLQSAQYEGGAYALLDPNYEYTALALQRANSWAYSNGCQIIIEDDEFSVVSLLRKNTFSFSKNSNSSWIIIVVSIIGLTSVGAYFFYRKRKEE